MKISGLTLAVASAVFSNTFALSASAPAPLELKYFNARGDGGNRQDHPGPREAGIQGYTVRNHTWNNEFSSLHRCQGIG